MRPTTACVPIQTEKRIARAFFARQCGIELQHQRECGFNSIGFYFNTHRRYAGSYFYFCGSFSFPLISTLASWRARSTNTGPAETYVHIWYRKLRLKNSIRNDCLRMVVQYCIFLSDCRLDFSLTACRANKLSSFSFSFRALQGQKHVILCRNGTLRSAPSVDIFATIRTVRWKDFRNCEINKWLLYKLCKGDFRPQDSNFEKRCVKSWPFEYALRVRRA